MSACQLSLPKQVYTILGVAVHLSSILWHLKAEFPRIGLLLSIYHTSLWVA